MHLKCTMRLRQGAVVYTASTLPFLHPSSCSRPLAHISNHNVRRSFRLSSTRLFSTTTPRRTTTTTTTEAISSSRLTGRTCMITGGTSGIGFAIAERFLREGAARVILVGRSYERLTNAAAKLDNSSLKNTTAPLPSQGSMVEASDKVSLLVGDVSNASSWQRELEKAMHPVDILVNAAGISMSSILPKTEPEDITHVLRTNLEGAVLTSRAFLRASIRSRVRKSDKTTAATHAASRCIINISSLLALKGGTGAVPYAASKAGLLGLTRSLTVEAASSLRDISIRSNAIVPGYIETPMIADFSEGENTRLKDSIPLRRFGRPDEVADAAVFLAQNEYANNCVLNLDGGLSAV